jgi:hypothetical protein
MRAAALTELGPRGSVSGPGGSGEGGVIKLKPLTYDEALAWLKRRGGTWRSDDVAGGAEVIARIGEVEGRCLPGDDTPESRRDALGSAIDELRRKVKR